MANGVFVVSRNAFLTGSINWPVDDVRAILIDTDVWTPDFVVDQFLSDVPGGARVATLGSSMTNKSVSSGEALADDTTWPNVAGPTSEAVLVYRHTGTEATSELIVYYDSGVAGIPVTPNGDDITVRWAGGAVLGF